MFHRMDDNMVKSKVTWISSYNFVCLLNIPQKVHNFGSVFHHWEGSGMGEKFVQVTKRHFNSFRKKLAFEPDQEDYKVSHNELIKWL